MSIKKTFANMLMCDGEAWLVHLSIKPQLCI